MLYLLPLNLETIRINQKTGNLPPLCLLIIPVRTGTSHETRERDVYVCLAGVGGNGGEKMQPTVIEQQ